MSNSTNTSPSADSDMSNLRSPAPTSTKPTSLKRKAVTLESADFIESLCSGIGCLRVDMQHATKKPKCRSQEVNTLAHQVSERVSRTPRKTYMIKHFSPYANRIRVQNKTDALITKGMTEQSDTPNNVLNEAVNSLSSSSPNSGIADANIPVAQVSLPSMSLVSVPGSKSIPQTRFAIPNSSPLSRTSAFGPLCLDTTAGMEVEKKVNEQESDEVRMCGKAVEESGGLVVLLWTNGFHSRRENMCNNIT
ncbi:hypothetical protein EJ08DRAFT_656319 [Tothia fuscella]|uniref:Uncharacterized protein n=1 Tax=Tothia fuscella TaxID=1048955 RepID=A0A9P4P268_9PEZI|nr:hypothetical protein EJ08DRAFT_656319 [Tothia fuscella]